MSDGMRSHQRDMDRIAQEYIAGIWPKKTITLDCTPGGGKTGSAVLLINRLLDANMIDKVLWLVPRISLAEQVLDGYSSGVFSCPDRRLEVVDGQDNLFAPSLLAPVAVGCVATYQAVASKKNWTRFRDAVAARRTLVIYDEVQFLSDEAGCENRGWYAKIEAIKEVAALNCIMSGTLWRTDNKPIPLVEYERRSDGKRYPIAHITYDLRSAVEQRAVLPTEWHNHSGRVEYSYNGLAQVHELLADGDDEESRKVRAFLSGDKAVCGLLDSMVKHWQHHRDAVYHSRMIVMADSIGQAKKWKQYLETEHKLSCVLATSRTEHAGRNLRHFRERRRGMCLVTVSMAYVGFDCPDLTHLAYLSAIRAPSWMLQSFARVSRYDKNAPVDYAHQHAYVFAPDDARMRRFAAWVRAQTEMGIRDRFRKEGERDKSDSADIVIPDNFEPIDAILGKLAIESLHGRIPPETEEALAAFVKACPAAAQMPRSVLHEVLSKAQVDLNRFRNAEYTSG